MNLFEEFKEYENLWEAVDFTMDLYTGPRAKCNKCGEDCAISKNVPLINQAWKHALGYYCTNCINELEGYEDLLDEFRWCSEDLPIMFHRAEVAGTDYLANMIQAWNNAKKDSRFIYTEKEVSKMEQDFIGNAKKTGLNIDSSVFTLSTVTAKDLSECKVIQ